MRLSRVWALRWCAVGLGCAVLVGVGVLRIDESAPKARAANPASRSVGTEPATEAPEPTASPAAAMPDQPNVVMVMADDMRVDDLAYMPRLHRLIAQHGVSFENSFSPFPLCCPARASFLTGQYAHNHKVLWHEPPFGYGSFDDSRTLATSLQRAGYRTGFIGKYLNRYGRDRSLVAGVPSSTYVPQGWDDWRGAIENPGDAAFHGDTYNYYDTPFNVNGAIDNRYRGVYQSKVVGDFSVDMADRFAKGRKPFFMYVNYVAPHHGDPRDPSFPWGVPDRTGRQIPVVAPAVPDNVRGTFDRRIRRGAGIAREGEPVEVDRLDKPPEIQKRTFRLTREARVALREAPRRRAEAVYVMDRNIARLVSRLKRTGEWRRTVFMFTSDNGMIMGEHGFGMTKVRAYEPSLRVPLLVTGPGLRTAQKRYDPISTVDLTATLLDLGGARAPHPADGVSRVPTLLNGDRGWTTPVVTEAIRTSGGHDPAFTDRRTTIGIRVSRYSYTRYRDGSAELYDLAADPRQDSNVADASRYADVRTALDRIWPRLKDCDGAQCHVPLPKVLTADPATNRADTELYWSAIRAAYGG
ncbi:MAG: sulfatase [Nocardioidaceae bacterium]|nr:sulfatase [Nocardioidaceae bacterium]